MPLTTHDLYDNFDDYFLTVLERVERLTPEVYLPIKEGLDELVYEMYFRNVSVAEAIKQIESILTHLGQYFCKPE